MADQNRNRNNRDGNNEENGIMDRIGEAIENVVDTVTGNDENNNQQKGRNNN